MKNKIISMILLFSIVLTYIPETVYAQDTSDTSFSIGQIGGYLKGNNINVSQLYNDRRFTENTGYGFAAENGNTLIDRIAGTNAEVVGGNNAKNGADRRIIGFGGETTWIQTKYCNSAESSVNAAFDSDGIYRYIKDGKPMQLEVPSDQFDKAVQLMENKIKEGKIPGITDPKEAKNLVRKGRYSFKQAVNLTKCMTPESLLYDAANGVISAKSAMGISFVLDYASCILNGKSHKEAAEESLKNAVKLGIAVFSSRVIAGQLMKSGLNKLAFTPTSQAIVKVFGKKVARAIVQAANQKVAAKVEEQAARIISETAVSSAVFVVAMTLYDVLELMNGRISKKQLLQNLVVVCAGVVGATIGENVGATAGTFIGGALTSGAGAPAGAVVGGVVGGVVGAVGASAVSSAAMEKYFENDADEMYKIISTEFEKLSTEYMIMPNEADTIITQLSKELSSDKLKDMYQSENRSQFAVDLMMPMFEKIINSREKIAVMNEYEVRSTYKDLLKGIVFIH